jgi:FtsZ-binding cell division protein ZapB
MTTLEDLLTLLNGQYIEEAGTLAQNQCVDLANSYIESVLGLPKIEFTNAVDFPDKAGDKYDYIENTPTGVPERGDLVIWEGTYGHIAIFLEGNANRFTSFDQNFPTGSPCHVQEHNYLKPKVKGWLRPKFKPVEEQIDWKNKYEEKAKLEIFLRGEIQKKDDTITNLNNQISDLEKDKNRLADELKECQQQIEANKDCPSNLIKQTELYNQVRQDYEKAKGEWSLREIDLGKRIKYLETKLEGYKTPIKDLIVDIWLKIVKGG